MSSQTMSLSDQGQIQRTRDLNELKKQALDFYRMNPQINKKLEDAINSLFYDSPYDTFGYLVNKKSILFQYILILI
jgi:hypothetical protein